MARKKVIVYAQTHRNDQLFTILERTQQENQLHPTNARVFDRVSRSQFKIAKRIEKNKHIPLISENQDTFTHGSLTKFDDHVKSMFPNGLPDQFEQLTFTQKKLLTQWGAEHVAVAMGIIDKIHSDHAENLELIRKFGVQDKQEIEVLQKRESNTLKQALEVSEETKSTVVGVKIGSEHRFFDVKECFPDIDLEIEDCAFYPKAATEADKAKEKKFYDEIYNEAMARQNKGFVCDNGTTVFSPIPLQSLTPSQTSTQPSANSTNSAEWTNTIGVGVFSLFVLGYGVYRFFKKAPEPEEEVKTETQTEKEEKQEKVKGTNKRHNKGRK